ncbi:MAG TPA: hypothetical protein VLB84_03125 [Bacteroidia bacterium]|nr:hypothetical protein [Bacteroidia bacterium]
MTSQLSTSDRGDNGLVVLNEKGNITWDFGGSPLKTEQKPIYTTDVYEFEYPLSFEQYNSFKDNRKRSFNISQTDTNHFSVFLERLEWKPSNSIGNFKVVKAYA